MKLLRVLAACMAAFAGAGIAAADDLRSCTDAEIAAAQRAPMPHNLASISDVSTDALHYAGYLVTIDAAGATSVACALDSFSDPKIRDRAAKAVSKFVYWPADATPAGTMAYVYVQSQGYGLTLPSVLPQKDDPTCDTLLAKVGAPPVKPIYQTKMVYPEQVAREGVGGTLLVVVEVKDTGATFLTCRGSGDNVDRLKEPAYYNAAGIRFPTEPGRAPFYYKLEYSFRVDYRNK